ncbi:prothymosin alpha-like [Chenopodium quinoa]|uniref:prothymosin alpha-like n=1 Tax=Chenopodium quinoa TaxID=63459 RepID=UPI000B788B67|nr:prothymosin alpha-like [Chenopodium quinoa]
MPLVFGLPASSAAQFIKSSKTSLLKDAPQEPDLVQMDKAMLKAIPAQDRESVKGVGTLNLEAILALLAEASATLQVKELEAARKKILELEKFVKDLKAQMASLKEADKEVEGLRARAGGEEETEDEASDSIYGESDQDEEDKQEADADEESPQEEEEDVDKEQPLIDDPNQAAANTVGPPPAA